MSRPVNVTVAGQRLSVRTAAKARYVKELAALVSAKVEEARARGRSQSTQKLALLAAMNIADELMQLREREQQLRRQVEEKTRRILDYIASAEA